MKRAEEVWQRVTGHIGGLTAGAIYRGLEEAGPCIRPGYRAVAERTLRILDSGSVPVDGVRRALDAAVDVQRGFSGDRAVPDLMPFLEPDPSSAFCCEGPVAVAVMTELSLCGALRDLPGIAESRPAVLRPCLDFLTGLGWCEPSRPELTDAGNIAAHIAPQYFHAAGYLPLFRDLPGIMVGDPESLAALEEDIHVRRDIDIASSTRVYEAVCRQPLREILLPLFDAPLDEQPDLLVDMGCGEGTLLAGVFNDIREHTLRGRHLKERPLVLVGADPSSVAREVCRATLQDLDTVFHVVPGDIADPDGLAEELRELGYDPGAALHMSKSVLHNRRLTADAMERAPVRIETGNVFSVNRGELAPPAQVAADLLALLQKWRPHTSRHGMVVIEAHTVDHTGVSRPELRSILAMNDATHGFSDQYLLEADAFRRIMSLAGFRGEAGREVGTEAFGAPMLTLGLYRSGC